MRGARTLDSDVAGFAGRASCNSLLLHKAMHPSALVSHAYKGHIHLTISVFPSLSSSFFPVLSSPLSFLCSLFSLMG